MVVRIVVWVEEKVFFLGLPVLVAMGLDLVLVFSTVEARVEDPSCLMKMLQYCRESVAERSVHQEGEVAEELGHG